MKLAALLLLALLAPSARAQRTVADYLKLADEKVKAGDDEGAFQLYTGILTQYPTQFVEVYFDRARILERAMEYKAAIADYDMILKLDSPDPKKAAMVRPRVYEARGKAKSILFDHKGAIADYTKALADSPGFKKYADYERSRILKDRAESRAYADDGKGAIADYTAALALDPKNRFVLADRAKVKKELRDWAGAIADYSAAIDLSEKPSSLDFEERGVARICKGDFAEALVDLIKSSELSRVTDMEYHHSPVMHDANLLIWSLRARLKGKDKADAELKAYAATTPPYGDTDLNLDLARFILGEAPESKPLELAVANDGKNKEEEGYTASQSVAHYFIGLKLLADGDAAGARARFDKVVGMKVTMQHMRELALAESKRLGRAAAKSR